MSLITPFAGLRPAPGRAADVLAPPYDVLNTEEAREMVRDRPRSFLHISKPEIDLPADTDPYDASVYARGAENFQQMVSDGTLVRDDADCYYAYRITMGDHQQTGLVAGASVAAYDRNDVRKHEYTRPKKEDDRVRQVDALNAQTGPVFLTYKGHEVVDRILRTASENTPEQPTQLAQKFATGKFVISVEMDPPRGLAPHKIIAGASMLNEAGADVINVADSPMARMRMSPWAVCELIQRDVGIETTLHFPTRGRNLLRVQGDLLAAHALDIRNVFVVMGDPTSIGDYPEAMDDYDLVPSGLMKLISHRFNQGVDHAGSDIGQPTSFFVGCALNLLPSNPEREIKVLRRKIANGANFALTQPVYQPDNALEFLELYEAQYGKLEIPVLVGVLPLYSVRHAAFLHNEVPGIVIPDEIRARIKMAGEVAPQEGVLIAAELVEGIKAWGQGIYVMPAFGRYDLAAEIIEATKTE